jgi:hypothetical protein
MKTVYDRRPLTQSVQLVTDSEDQQDDQDDQYSPVPPVNHLHPRVREFMQRTSGKEEYAPPPYSKGKGFKGKRDSSPMSNR